MDKLATAAVTRTALAGTGDVQAPLESVPGASSLPGATGASGGTCGGAEWPDSMPNPYNASEAPTTPPLPPTLFIFQQQQNNNKKKKQKKSGLYISSVVPHVSLTVKVQSCRHVGQERRRAQHD